MTWRLLFCDYFGVQIFYETSMFALTMAKLLTMEWFTVSGLRKLLIRYVCELGLTSSPQIAEWYKTNRDGMLYYCTITCARVANLVFFIRGNVRSTASLFAFTVAEPQTDSLHSISPQPSINPSSSLLDSARLS